MSSSLSSHRPLQSLSPNLIKKQARSMFLFVMVVDGGAAEKSSSDDSIVLTTVATSACANGDTY